MHAEPTLKLVIYYDGDCPFCDRYIKLLRLRDAVTEVALVDLRTDPGARLSLFEKGINTDLGMVVDVNGSLYAGHSALTVLAGLSSPAGLFNRLNAWIFRSRRAARIWYPILRAGRSAMLVLMGRHALDQDRSRLPPEFVLFNACWGLFALLHAVSYFSFFTDAKAGWGTALIGVLGFILLLYPWSRRAFITLLTAFCVDAWLQMPMNSNHTIMKNFLLLALLTMAMSGWFRGRTWADYYQAFAPCGRWLLVIMYVFGVFHKLNSGFINPETSCAVALWKTMPAPLSWLDNPWFLYMAIYGTLVIETVILVAILLQRSRLYGIAVGIAFHALLSLSAYAMYAQFSMLTIALHVLFISPTAARRIVDSEPWRRFHGRLRSPAGVALALLWLTGMAALAYNHSFSQLSILWLPVVAWIAWIIISEGGQAERRGEIRMISSSFLANCVSLLFFFNCITPYLGLKTAQSINMFANLRLEGGESNHLVLPWAPGPFSYLADTVRIDGSSGSPYLRYIEQNDLRMVYYDMLDELERNPGVVVSYTRNGQLHPNQTAATLAAEIDQTLHPQWFRKWFHFLPVDVRSPKPCAIDR